MKDKQVRARYTPEFKLEAVRQVRAGQAIGVVARVLGIPKASLGNWVRAETKGELPGVAGGEKEAKVSPEQMEIARLRAEVVRLRMERDIAKNVHGGVSASQCHETRRGVHLICTRPWPEAFWWRLSPSKNSNYSAPHRA